MELLTMQEVGGVTDYAAEIPGLQSQSALVHSVLQSAQLAVQQAGWRPGQPASSAAPPAKPAEPAQPQQPLAPCPPAVPPPPPGAPTQEDRAKGGPPPNVVQTLQGLQQQRIAEQTAQRQAALQQAAQAAQAAQQQAAQQQAAQAAQAAQQQAAQQQAAEQAAQQQAAEQAAQQQAAQQAGAQEQTYTAAEWQAWNANRDRRQQGAPGAQQQEGAQQAGAQPAQPAQPQWGAQARPRSNWVWMDRPDVSVGKGHRTGFKLWIGDLPKEMNTTVLWEWLGSFTGITDMIAIQSQRAKRPYGIVTFASGHEAKYCKETIEKWTWDEPSEFGGMNTRHCQARFVHISHNLEA